MTTALPGMRRVEMIMGLPIVIDVRDACASDELLDEAFGEFRSVDARFSTYREDSEISRINSGELAVSDAHRDVRSILAQCDQLRLATDGFFDARAASDTAVDPSGLVKGWSVDRVVAIIEHAGMGDFAVSAGGDVVVRGRALPDEGEDAAEFRHRAGWPMAARSQSGLEFGAVVQNQLENWRAQAGEQAVGGSAAGLCAVPAREIG